MFTRMKGERDRERERDRDRDRISVRRRKAPRPPMLSLPRSNSIKFLPSRTGRIEEETARGMMWSVKARRGRRRTSREDMYTTLPFIAEIRDEPVSIFAIFDGHGGKRAAEYACKRLPNLFLERLRSCGDVRESLEHAFLATDDELFDEFSKREEGSRNPGTPPPSTRRSTSLFSRKSRLNVGESSLAERKSPKDESVRKLTSPDECAARNGSGCGCTATVVTLTGNILCVAHVGDSRAVLSSQQSIRRLCEDHRAGRADEQERIESSGGMVIEVSGTQRVNGVLAISRSIGDVGLKDFVIAKPDVMQVSLRGDEEFVVMATDGLWDVVSDDECVSVVREMIQGEDGEEDAVKKLVDMAWERGSNDDTCVLVVNIVKYVRLINVDVAERAEFVSPDAAGQEVRKNEKKNEGRRHVRPARQIPMEMVTPHAQVAPTPRAHVKNPW